jgi:hypothetical protein
VVSISIRNFDRFSLDTDDLELRWLQNNKEILDNPDFRRAQERNAFKLIVIDV